MVVTGADQVRHLSRLVDDLLDVTRISRNKIQLQEERVELCDLVRRSADDQRSVFERPKPPGIPALLDALAG